MYSQHHSTTVHVPDAKTFLQAAGKREIAATDSSQQAAGEGKRRRAAGEGKRRAGGDAEAGDPQETAALHSLHILSALLASAPAPSVSCVRVAVTCPPWPWCQASVTLPPTSSVHIEMFCTQDIVKAPQQCNHVLHLGKHFSLYCTQTLLSQRLSWGLRGSL